MLADSTRPAQVQSELRDETTLLATASAGGSGAKVGVAGVILLTHF